MMNHNEYMKIAIEEAYEGINNRHGGPFGCVIVKDGKIIGKGHNRVLLHAMVRWKLSGMLPRIPVHMIYQVQSFILLLLHALCVRVPYCGQTLTLSIMAVMLMILTISDSGMKSSMQNGTNPMITMVKN